MRPARDRLPEVASSVLSAPLNFQPLSVGLEIVRRDEDLEAMDLGSFEDAIHVIDGVIFRETLMEQRPRESSFTQDFILWGDKDNGRVTLLDIHS
jgi:hypothetical protein